MATHVQDTRGLHRGNPQVPTERRPVATAIPAFIGYTQKADRKQPSDLKLTADAHRVSGRVRAVLRASAG